MYSKVNQKAHRSKFKLDDFFGNFTVSNFLTPTLLLLLCLLPGEVVVGQCSNANVTPYACFQAYLFSLNGNGGTNGSYITNVNVTDANGNTILNNSSGDECDTYSNFTGSINPAVYLASGDTYTFTISHTVPQSVIDNYLPRIAIFLDYNGNSVFSYNTESLIQDIISSTGSLTYSVTIPSTSIVGSTRFRIVLAVTENYSANSFVGSRILPCGCEYDYGEAEDYPINIIDCSTASPIGVSFVSSGSLNTFPSGTAQTPSGQTAQVLGGVNSPFNFNGSTTPLNPNNFYTYEWDFGDGSTATGLNASHTYGSEGNYTACLTVTDFCGNTTQSCQNVRVICDLPFFFYEPLAYYIRGVEFANISNIPTGDPYGPPYTDYTNMTGFLDINQSYTLEVSNDASTWTYPFPSSPGHVAAWIDYNQDGDFDDVGEKLDEQVFSYAGETLVLNFTVPAPCSGTTEVYDGTTTLRVMHATIDGASPLSNGEYLQACGGSYTCGEIEDYTVSINTNKSLVIDCSASGVCPGESVTLSYSGNYGNSHQWFKDGIDLNSYGATYQASAPGLYTLVISNTSTGCVCNAEINVASNQIPTATLVCNTPSVCAEDMNNGGVPLSAVNVNSSNNVAWYYLPLGSSLEVNQSDFYSNFGQINVTQEGIYALVVQSPYPDYCSDTLFQEVTIFPPPEPIIIGDDQVCIGSLTTLSTAPVYTSYIWTDASGTVVSTGPTANVPAGTYTVEVTEQQLGCSGISIPFVVTNLPSPTLTNPTPDPYCEPQCVNPVPVPGGLPDGNAVGTYSIYLPGVGTGSGRYVFENAESAFTQNTTTNTATFGGTIYNQDDPTEQWELNIVLYNQQDWTTWSANGGSYHYIGSTPIGDAYETWTYYEIDYSNSFLTGLGSFAGQTININPYSNTQLGFQVGTGANAIVPDYGVGAWFSFSGDFTGNLGDVNVAFCSGCDGGYSFDVNSTNGVANATLSPSNGLSWGNGISYSGNQIVVSGLCAGSYTLTIEDSNGCTTSQSFNLDLLNTESVELGPDQTHCADGNTITLSPGATGSAYQWSTNATSSTINITADVANSGSYSVTVYNTAGCASIDEVDLNFVPLPQPVITGPTSICPNSLATLSVSTAFDPVLWSTGESTHSIQVGAGTYTVNVTDPTTGCNASTSITVVQNPPITALNTTTVDYCENEPCQGTATLDLSSSFTVTNLAPTGNYTVSGNTVNVTGLCGGNYILTVADQDGCLFDMPFTIIILDAPDIDAGPDQSVCIGNNVQLNGSVGISNNYSWSPSNGLNNANSLNPIFTPTAPGTYTFTLSGSAANGCSDTDDVTITILNVPQPTITGNLTVCPGSTTNLTVTGGNFTSIQWSTNETTSTINVGVGTYSVTVGDGNCSATTSVTVTQNTPPIITNYQPQLYCEPQCVDPVPVPGGLPDGNAVGTYSIYLPGVGAGDGSYVFENAESVFTQNITAGTATFGGTIYNQDNPSEQWELHIDLFSQQDWTAWSNGGNSWHHVYPNTIGDAYETWMYYNINYGASYLTGLGDFAGMTINLNPYAGANFGFQVGTAANAITTDYGVGAWFSFSGDFTGNLGDVNVAFCNGCSGTATFDIGSASGVANASLTPSNGLTWGNGISMNGNNQIVVNGLCAGAYTLTVVDVNGCSSTQNFVLDLLESEIIDLGPDQTHCADGSIITLNPGGTGTSYQWYLNGAPIGNMSTLDIPADPTNTGSCVVSVISSDGCESIDEVDLTFLPLPQPVITGPTTICAGSLATLSVSNAFDPVLWSTGESTYSIQVGLGTHTVNVTDPVTGCNASTNITITENPPITSITNTVPYCENEPCQGAATLNLSSSFTVMGLVPAGNYTVSGNTVNATDLCAGNYILTVADQDGCSNDISFVINELPAPNIDAGPDQAICMGGSVQLNGTVVNSNNYSWSPSNGLSNANSLNPTFTPTAPGTYTFELSGSATNGCSSADEVVITVFDTPVANAGTDMSLCGGDPFVLGGTPTVSGGTLPFTYLWTDIYGVLDDVTLANPTFISNASTPFGQPMTFMVTVTDANGCSATDDITLTLYPDINAEVQCTSDPCAGEPTTLYAYPQDIIGNTYAYEWFFNGNPLNEYTYILDNMTQAGDYTVEITDLATGCTDSYTFIVTPRPTPQPQIDCPDPTVCPDGSTPINLTIAQPGGGVFYIDYMWWVNDTLISGVNSASLTVIYPGEYVVNVVDSYGCTGSDTLVVTPRSVIKPIISVTDSTLCPGETATITLDNAGDYTGYTWQPGGQTSSSITVSQPGTYTVTMTGGLCNATNSVVITAGAPINVDLPDTPQIACQGNSIIVDAGGFSNVTYAWSDGQSTQNATFSTSGNYCVTVTDPSGCSGTDCVDIVISQSLIADAGPDLTICAGSSTPLADPTIPVASGSTPPYTFVWTPSLDLDNANIEYPTATPSTSTTYHVLVTDANGCTASDSVHVTVNPIPTVDIQGLATICDGGLTILSAVPSGYASYDWQYNGASIGVNAPTLDATVDGIYTVVVSDGGCSSSANFTVTVNPLPTPVIDCPVPTICPNTTTTMTVVPPANGAYTSYVWCLGNDTIPNAVNDSWIADAVGTYTVKVTDANGCVATANIVIDAGIPPQPSIAGDLAICTGGSTTLSVAADGNNYVDYEWYFIADGSQVGVGATLPVTLPGAYMLKVREGGVGSCWGCDTVFVDGLPAPEVTFTQLCERDRNNNNTGRVRLDVAANGGLPPYNFDITDEFGNAYIVNDTIPDSTLIYMQVTDVNGCTASDSVRVGPCPLPPTITAGYTCNGDGTATLNVSAQGGDGNYSFTYINGSPAADGDILANGTPVIIILTDGTGQTVTSAPFFVDCTPAIQPPQVNVTCNVDGTATLNLVATGGAGPYTFTDQNGTAWNDGDTVANGTLLVITATDANGDTAVAAGVTVNCIQPLTLDVDYICNLDGTATLGLIGTGGDSIYVYTYDDGTVANVGDILMDGQIFSITLSDGSGLSITSPIDTVNCTQPLAIDANFTCNADGTATLNLGATGGNGNYTFTDQNGTAWNDGDTVASGTTLVLTVTDLAGQSLTANALVIVCIQPLTIDASYICNVDGTASLVLLSTGGDSTYVYTYADGTPATNGDILVDGDTIQITVSDGSGLSVTAPSFVVNCVQPLTVDVNFTCNADGTATLNLGATGGDGNYTFIDQNGTIWADGDIVPNGTSLIITASDLGGQSITASVVVVVCIQPLVITTTLVCNPLDGTATLGLIAVGGDSTYVFTYLDGTPANDGDILASGDTVQVIVNDGVGTPADTSLVLINDCIQPLTIDANFTCNADGTATLNLSATGGLGGYTFTDQNGTIWTDGDIVPSGTTLILTVTDLGGVSLTANALVVVCIQPLTVDASYLCNPDGTATLVLLATGGDSTYVFTYADGTPATNGDILADGAMIEITVSDASGTTPAVSGMITVDCTQPLDIDAGMVCNPVDGTASIVINPTLGGDGMYTYTYLDGTPAVAGDLIAYGDTVQIIVNDGSGTLADTSVLIINDCVQPLVPTATYTCTGNGGAVLDLQVTGGVGPYTFVDAAGTVWNDGDVVANNTTITLTLTDSNTPPTSVIVPVIAIACPELSVTYLCEIDPNGNQTGNAILTVLTTNAAGFNSSYTDGQVVQNGDTITVELYGTNNTVVADTTVVIQNCPITYSPLDIDVTYDCNLDGTATLNLNATGGDGLYIFEDITGNVVSDGDVVPDNTTVTITVIDGQGTVAIGNPVNINCGCVVVQGTVFREFVANGVLDSSDIELAGITVTAYDSDGNVVYTDVTDNMGGYDLDVNNVGDVRIEFTNIPPYLYPSPIGTNSNTLVQFVSSDNCVADLGLHNPADYCQADPPMFTGCFIEGDQALQVNEDVLVSFNYSDRGTGNGTKQTEALAPDLGSTWGLAYSPFRGDLYAAAFQKRHVGYGPNGPGAIYAKDLIGNTISTFFNAGVAAGVNPHASGAVNFGIDSLSWDLVGKMSWGDIDISEDEQILYAVNLASKELYAININTPAVYTTHPIPVPNAIANSNDMRPFALKFHDGLLYVGLTQTGESTQSLTDLHGYVYTFDPTIGSNNGPSGTGGTFSATPVFDFPLNYARGCAVFGCIPNFGDANWRPWTPTWEIVLTNYAAEYVYPQPWFTDIEFTDNGDMILGIRDRYGDQTGVEQRSTDPTDFSLYTGNAAGDILIACNSGAGSWTLENNASTCNNTGSTNGLNNGQGPGGGEFFFDERYVDNGSDIHDETSLGGLAVLHGTGEVGQTQYDIFGIYEGAVGWHSTANGSGTGGKRIYQTDRNDLNSPTFGKGGGLSDLETICDPAPLIVGNRVWADLDGDGIQDAGEAGLSGMIVELRDAAGLVLASTTTDNNGEYTFSSANTPLDYFNSYYLTIDMTQNASVNGLTLTDMGGSDALDSDASIHVVTGVLASISFNTNGPGTNNYTYDFGFTVSLQVTPFSYTCNFAVQITPTCFGDGTGIINDSDISIAVADTTIYTFLGSVGVILGQGDTYNITILNTVDNTTCTVTGSLDCLGATASTFRAMDDNVDIPFGMTAKVFDPLENDELDMEDVIDITFESDSFDDGVGTLNRVSNDGFALEFKPLHSEERAFAGRKTVSYTVHGKHGRESTATITVNVSCPKISFSPAVNINCDGTTANVRCNIDDITADGESKVFLTKFFVKPEGAIEQEQFKYMDDYLSTDEEINLPIGENLEMFVIVTGTQEGCSEVEATNAIFSVSPNCRMITSCEDVEVIVDTSRLSNGATEVNVVVDGYAGDYEFFIPNVTESYVPISKLVIDEPGDYKVFVRHTHTDINCDIERSFKIDIPIDLNDIQVYPNPSDGTEVNVKLNFPDAETVQIRVFNTVGQIVMVTEKGTDGVSTLNLDLSHLARGTYYLEATTNQTSVTKPIVIK